MTRQAPLPCTFLFAPADDRRKGAKALRSDADAAILDLEDAVEPSRKPDARSMLAELLDGERSGLCYVRVNGLESGELQRDLEALAGLPIAGIVLPKATPAALEVVPADVPVIALVESAAGLRAVDAIAAHGLVERLMLGPVDLAAELGLRRRTDGLELLLARSELVLASRVAGIAAPIDGVLAMIEDTEALRRETTLARDVGMGGKACIHPRQIAVVHAVFHDEQELAWARGVVDAYDAAARVGRGVLRRDDEMIDLAVVERARRVLDGAGHNERKDGTRHD
jgi:citrate lyase subunit beta/citryl-CoA lyase